MDWPGCGGGPICPRLPSMPESAPGIGGACCLCCCCSSWLFLRSWVSTSSIVMIFCIDSHIAEQLPYVCCPKWHRDLQSTIMHVQAHERYGV